MSALKDVPDEKGFFGRFGGQYLPETLMPALEELTREYMAAKADPQFQEELNDLLEHYVGRPSPAYYASRLSSELGVNVYLKREDLNHTGAHKINNTLGQALLAVRMGKPRVIAETGAGQHGVATATAAALFGLECAIYMGTEDIRRQAPNVERMKLLGAELYPVESGSCTLKDALNEALRDWVTNVRRTHYIIGSVAGPHPYPMMVRDFQSVIGREARGQMFELTGRLPDMIIACVGGGSNAIGIFYDFLEDQDVKLIGVEAAGTSIESGKHAATLCAGRPGILHGAVSYLLDDDDGQIRRTHSVSAGLDYPGVGPEHSYLQETGRAEYVAATDAETLQAFHQLTTLEGILPALESAHALGYLNRIARDLPKTTNVLVCLSGRGDKDVDIIREQTSGCDR